MTQWKLFDFDAHFDAFWEAWNEDSVQSALQDYMDCWCEEEHGHIDDSQPMWHRGDPLWELSSSNLWDEIIDDAVNKDLWKIWPSYSLYTRTMKAQRLPVMDIEAFDDMVFDDVLNSDEFVKFRQEHEPKPGTLESLVMFGGRNHLLFPLALCAKHMFPDATIALGQNVRGGQFVILPEEATVFDLEDFYLSTRRGYIVQYEAFETLAELVATSDDV